MKEQLWSNIERVRSASPLVHNITNFVVMNNTANALLAVGASPIMAHAHEEIEEMVGLAGSCVINIGTLDKFWVQSMMSAVVAAKKLKKPWILDPVGAGATSYRNHVISSLIQFDPTVIRGNASEIMSIAYQNTISKGVDSTNQSTEAIEAALLLQGQTGAVICISGSRDFIISDQSIVKLSNGHPLMAKVTGMGCTATAIIGAFCALPDITPLDATVSAMALMGVAGEIAAAKASGPGTMQLNFLDALYNITMNDFTSRLKISNESI